MKTYHPILMNTAADTAAPAGGGGGGGTTTAAPATTAAPPTQTTQTTQTTAAEPATRSAGDYSGFKTTGPVTTTADAAKGATVPVGGFMEFLENSIKKPEDTSKTVDTAKPGDKTTTEPGKEGTTVDTTKPGPAFDIQAWLDKNVPTDPTGIAKVEDWKAQRGLLQKALSDLNELGLENAMLKKAGPATTAAKAADATAVTMPETEAVKALQVENESLKQRIDAELKEWNEHKARTDLDSNPAFRAEFDGKRAGLVAEMEAVAEEAGIDKSIIQTLVDAGTEYKINKALEDLEDPTAKSLLASKARAFVGLSQAKEAARQNPLDEVRKWNDYHQSMNGVVATTIAKDLQGAYLTAVGEVASQLTAKDGDIFFQTPGGRNTIEAISQRLTRGVDITPKEVIEALAAKEAYTVYRSLGEKQAAQIVALKQELARYAAADPARILNPADTTGGGATKTGGFQMSKMFGG